MSARKQPTPATAHSARGAMGEYIAKTDRTLTSLAQVTPGPSDYCPNTKANKQSSSEWSIVGKPKEPRGAIGPPPTQYTTSKSMDWDRKTVTLKQKGKLCPLGPRPDVHVTSSKGPNAYNVTYGDTGHLTKKFSISHRLTQGTPGTPGTIGADAPPPTYVPADPPGLQYTLPSKLPVPSDTDGPGPAGSSAPHSVRGPEYSLGPRLDNELMSSTDITLPRFYGWNVGFTPFRKTNVEDSPGPAYNIGTTMGSGLSKSVAWRQGFHISKEGKVPAWPDSNRRAPAPGSYNVRFSDKPNIPKQTMGPATIENTDLQEPGPNHYKPDKDELKAQYTFGTKGKPKYPEILNYVEHSMAADIPAPHKFCGPSNFSKNNGPSAVIGGLLKKPPCKNPGPNHYRPDKPKSHIPQFSIASKVPIKDDNAVPGPGSYTIKPKPSTPMFKMTGRPKVRAAESTPAPNSYNVAAGQTNKSKSGGPAITLKGRPSPYVYSGFRNLSKVSTLVQ